MRRQRERRGRLVRELTYEGDEGSGGYERNTPTKGTTSKNLDIVPDKNIALKFPLSITFSWKSLHAPVKFSV
jgi:hypothetical protein